MKAIKTVMLVIGTLAFVVGALNIIFKEISISWFGFISGAFLIWLYFNIDKFRSADYLHRTRKNKME